MTVKKYIPASKLEQVLIDKDLSQGELMRLIEQRFGLRIGRDRISKMCTGRLINLSAKTLVIISTTLEVPVASIMETSRLLPKKKKNKR